MTVLKLSQWKVEYSRVESSWDSLGWHLTIIKTCKWKPLRQFINHIADGAQVISFMHLISCLRHPSPFYQYPILPLCTRGLGEGSWMPKCLKDCMNLNWNFKEGGGGGWGGSSQVTLCGWSLVFFLDQQNEMKSLPHLLRSTLALYCL